MGKNLDSPIRLACFQFLEEQTQIHGDVIPRAVLAGGFVFENEQVHLIGPKGIFTPRLLDYPLSICTVPPNMRGTRPYDDELGENGVIRYKYRGTDPQHGDNHGLRQAMKLGLPLVYLFGVVPGKYLPVWPAFVVADDPTSLTFAVSVDERSVAMGTNWNEPDIGTTQKRRYITVETQQRLHQRGFRERVLRAYSGRCAICQLRHPELLEASHILPDKHPLGDPVIPNGISLCKLHHAAYDRNILGVSPDYVIDIRSDILEEVDGPMLRFGLQDIKGQRIRTPRQTDFRPSRDRLSIRYAEFKKAG